MSDNITSFDTQKHHIHLECFVTDAHGIISSISGILDTGAPQTEFSDQFLTYAGFLKSRSENVIIPTGLQTHKYGKLMLPSVSPNHSYILNANPTQVCDFENFSGHAGNHGVIATIVNFKWGSECSEHICRSFPASFSSLKIAVKAVTRTASHSFAATCW